MKNNEVNFSLGSHLRRLFAIGVGLAVFFAGCWLNIESCVRKWNHLSAYPDSGDITLRHWSGGWPLWIFCDVWDLRHDVPVLAIDAAIIAVASACSMIGAWRHGNTVLPRQLSIRSLLTVLAGVSTWWTITRFTYMTGPCMAIVHWCVVMVLLALSYAWVLVIDLGSLLCRGPIKLARRHPVPKSRLPTFGAIGATLIVFSAGAWLNIQSGLNQWDDLWAQLKSGETLDGYLCGWPAWVHTDFSDGSKDLLSVAFDLGLIFLAPVGIGVFLGRYALPVQFSIRTLLVAIAAVATWLGITRITSRSGPCMTVNEWCVVLVLLGLTLFWIIAIDFGISCLDVLKRKRPLA